MSGTYDDPTVLDTCAQGLYECASNYYGYFLDDSESTWESPTTCANYDNKYQDMEGLVWPIVVGFIVLMMMCVGIGSNDAANSWATSVGSGAISLKWACITAGFFDLLGAVTLGSGVSTKIAKGVSDVTNEECFACGYCNSSMSFYTVGMLACLLAAALCLFLASSTKMPVSTTHAIVGAVIGFTMGAVGPSCVKWDMSGVSAIIVSWVASPTISGISGVLIYWLTEKYIIKAVNPLENMKKAMPIFFTLSTFLLTYLSLMKSNSTKGLDWWWHVIGAFVLASVVCLVAIVKMMPHFIKTMEAYHTPENLAKIEAEEREKELQNTKQIEMSDIYKTDVRPSESAQDIVDIERENEEVKGLKETMFLFKYLLVFIAALESFAHGSNDTANGTGAFTAVWEGYSKGRDMCEQDPTPIWIMFLGGIFIFIGIYFFARNVIQTIGSQLAKIDYHRGFCIEFGSTVGVIAGTLAEVPVSTTHAQIGAVLFVSYKALGKEKVDWFLSSKIVMSWILTLPISGFMAWVFALFFRWYIEN